MRVLLIWHGAAGLRYPERLEALASSGLELTLVTPRRWIHPEGRCATPPVRGRGYEVVPLPVLWPRHGALYAYVGGLPSVFKRMQPDVVHIHEEPYALSTAQAMAVARLFSPRAAIVVEAWQNLMKSFPPPFRWIERWVLRQADGFIAGNDDVRKVLQHKGAAAPIHLVPLAVSPQRFRRVPRDGLRRELAGPSSFVVGYVGRLDAAKGVDLLLRAAAGEEQWSVVVIGAGPDAPRLQRMAQALGIRERVRFTGPVSQDALPRYLSSLDVLVLPSISTPRWVEQFGRVLVEAMACEVPVVGSSSGEIPRVIADAGLVFPEGDVPALHRCLARLQSDPSLAGALAARGLARVREHFTWERVAQLTRAAYLEALERRARRLPRVGESPA